MWRVLLAAIIAVLIFMSSGESVPVYAQSDPGQEEDIYDALSKGAYRDGHKVLYGHGGSYYRSSDSQIHETVANYGALSVTRPDLIEMLRQDKPELVAALEKNVQKMLEKAGGTK